MPTITAEQTLDAVIASTVDSAADLIWHSATQADLVSSKGKRVRVGVSQSGEIIVYFPDGPGIQTRTNSVGKAAAEVCRALTDHRTAAAARRAYIAADSSATAAYKESRYMLVNGYGYNGKPYTEARLSMLCDRLNRAESKRNDAARRLAELGADV